MEMQSFQVVTIWPFKGAASHVKAEQKGPLVNRFLHHSHYASNRFLCVGCVVTACTACRLRSHRLYTCVTVAMHKL